MVLRKSFYIRWSAGRSPRVHEVNPGRDPSHCERRHKGYCWRLTGACLVCESNEHKVKDCPRARFFTTP